jgi:hypothetical protein
MAHAFRALSPASLLIDDVEIGPDRIVITARCRAAAGERPDCGRRSGRMHSCYGGGYSTCHLMVAPFSRVSRFADFVAPHPIVHDVFLQSGSTRPAWWPRIVRSNRNRISVSRLS